MNRSEIALTTQTSLLFAGTGFAWYTVYSDVVAFYSVYGTLFRFSDCSPANPLAQACFYGAFAFLGGFIWSLRILQDRVRERFKNQQRLLYLLIFGTIFAWSSFGYMAYSQAHATPNPFTCTVNASDSLFLTPCFVGSVLFLLSLIAGIASWYVLRRR